MATPKLELIRFYRGMVREQIVSLWCRALRSGSYTKSEKYLHRPAYAPVLPGKHNGAYDVYGVLCHALELPRRIETTPKGMLFAYANSPAGEYSVDMLPPELHAFLVTKGRSKLRVDLSSMVTNSPVLFAKILNDTGLERANVMRMEPTLGMLNDLGVKFGTMSLLLETNHW